MRQIGKIINGKFVPFADIGGGKIILPENKVVVTDDQGNLSTVNVSTEEVGFLAGLSGNVQEEINYLSHSNYSNYSEFPDSNYMMVREREDISVIKLGNVCMVTGEVIAKKTWQGEGHSTGLQLPSPIKKTWGFGSTYFNTGYITKILINEDGYLIFQNGNEGTLYGFCIMYISKQESSVEIY